MAIVPDHVRDQLRTRFESRLTGPAQVTLYTRPGSSRLILPSGVGCETCEAAREIAEALRDAAPKKVSLEVIDVTVDAERAQTLGISAVPTLSISSNGDGARIRFQGLPAGTEFAALIDAVERVSRGEHGLTAQSVAGLGKLTQPIEVMVFATPT